MLEIIKKDRKYKYIITILTLFDSIILFIIPFFDKVKMVNIISGS